MLFNNKVAIFIKKIQVKVQNLTLIKYRRKILEIKIILICKFNEMSFDDL